MSCAVLPAFKFTFLLVSLVKKGFYASTHARPALLKVSASCCTCTSACVATETLLVFKNYVSSVYMKKSDCKYNYESEKSRKKHFVTPINLIIAIIINYQLSIDRSSLEFTLIIFFY